MGASRTETGATVQGGLDWRKLEERREAKALLCGKRLEGLAEDSRLVRVVVQKLKDAGNVGWWEEYGVAMLRKDGLTKEDQADATREKWKGGTG